MNALRTSFLVATDALVIVMLVSLLSACGGAPTRYRNGDFISNMASAESPAGTRSATRPSGVPT